MSGDASVHDAPLEDRNGLRDAGNAAFAKGAYSNAIALYIQALEAKGPEDPELLGALSSNRAAVHMNMPREHYKMALADAMKAIAHRPNWTKGYYRKAVALQALGHHKEALQVLTDEAKHLLPTLDFEALRR